MSQAKFTLNESPIDSWFLPSKTEVFELLGLPTTLIGQLKMAGVKLPKSNSTLKKLQVEGLSRKKLFEYSNFFIFQYKIPDTLFSVGRILRLTKLIRRSLTLNSNAGYWQNTIESFLLGLGRNDHLGFVAKFILERSEKELKAKDAAVKNGFNDVLNERNPEFLFEFIRNNTLVNRELVQNYEKRYSKYARQEKIDHSELETFLQFYTSLVADFYWCMLAHYEVGHFLVYEGKGHSSKSFFSILIDDFFEHGYRSFFESWLAQLQKQLYCDHKFHDENISWRHLSSFIDIAEPAPSIDIETLSEKKWNKMKKWRKGLDLPSDKSIELFIEHFMDSLGLENGSGMFFEHYKISRALDKLAEKYKKQLLPLDEKSQEKVLKHVFEQYQSYWDSCYQCSVLNVDQS